MLIAIVCVALDACSCFYYPFGFLFVQFQLFNHFPIWFLNCLSCLQAIGSLAICLTLREDTDKCRLAWQ